MNAMTAREVIDLLELAPHPEGGHFRETFRDAPLAGLERAQSTAIYFLLQADEVSRWHRIDAAEVWHWYAGAPLLLRIAGENNVQELRLGSDLTQRECPQAVVPAHVWQQARSLGAWTLVSCTVAPGFEFRGFDLAPAGFEPH
jgi:predicted cupin superfamily sugar epimerase